MRLWLLPVVLILGGCATHINCPAPDEPVTVYLLDHGRHPSLVLPADPGTMVRYSYGDRRWYAQSDTGFMQGAAALFRRTPAVLGRRVLPMERSGIHEAVRVHIAGLHSLEVEHAKAAELRAALDSIFHQGHHEKVLNDTYDLEFVPHPRPYTIWYNSNHMVADWLRSLGCEVDRPAIGSQWHVPAS